MYFTVGTESDNVAAVQAQLQQFVVAATQLTDAEQALQEFMAASADSSSLTAALVRLPENPLPATLQVSVVSDASLEELGAVRERLVGLNGVDEVVIERTWLSYCAI